MSFVNAAAALLRAQSGLTKYLSKRSLKESPTYDVFLCLCPPLSSRLIGEEDMLQGLWRGRPLATDTRAAMALMQHAFWKEGQEAVARAMSQWQQVLSLSLRLSGNHSVTGSIHYSQSR